MSYSTCDCVGVSGQMFSLTHTFSQFRENLRESRILACESGGECENGSGGSHSCMRERESCIFLAQHPYCNDSSLGDACWILWQTLQVSTNSCERGIVEVCHQVPFYPFIIWYQDLAVIQEKFALPFVVLKPCLYQCRS